MDPYLEARWSDVHAKLIAFIGEALQPELPAGLRARSEERVLLEGPGEKRFARKPDVAVVDIGRYEAQLARTGGAVAVATLEPMVIQFAPQPDVERWVQIIDVTSGGRVVTAIEVLSPGNKSSGQLNKSYLQKLDDYARAGVSVVEIDLLRSSRHRLPVDRGDLPARGQVPYLISLRRGPTPGRWEVYPVVLQQPIPRVPVPLRETDADVPLDLQPLMERVYRAGGHDDIDYSAAAVPELEGADAAWAAELLAHAGLRPAAG